MAAEKIQEKKLEKNDQKTPPAAWKSPSSTERLHVVREHTSLHERQAGIKEKNQEQYLHPEIGRGRIKHNLPAGRQPIIRNKDQWQKLHLSAKGEQKDYPIPTSIQNGIWSKAQELYPKIDGGEKDDEIPDGVPDGTDDRELQKGNDYRTQDNSTKTIAARKTKHTAKGNQKTKSRKTKRGKIKSEKTKNEKTKTTPPDKRKQKGSIKASLSRLEEKEHSTESLEIRLKALPDGRREEQRKERRSSAAGRLHSPIQAESSSKGASAEKKLNTKRSTRIYQDKEEKHRHAAHSLKSSKEKKQKKKERKRKDKDKKKKKKNGKLAAVSNWVQKGRSLTQQLDSNETASMPPEQGFFHVLADRIKKMGTGVSSRTIKWILLHLCSLLIQILSLLVSAIVSLVSIIIGAILAAIGPVILIVVCVASIFAFLFVEDTGVADTTDPAYIDQYIAALLVGYRENILEDYVNEPYTFGASYLQYDVCFDLRGRNTSHIHDMVSYGREDEVMDHSYMKARKKAAASVINEYFGKKSSYREEFMEDIKMIYFAKMYAKDHVAVQEATDSNGQMAPYLMIDTKKEEEALTEVFHQFCTIDVDLETHPSWAKENRPWPYRLNGQKPLDQSKQIYETMAATATVRLKTMEAYLQAFPLSSEEQAHYDEFTRIREKQ